MSTENPLNRPDCFFMVPRVSAYGRFDLVSVIMRLVRYTDFVGNNVLNSFHPITQLCLYIILVLCNNNSPFFSFLFSNRGI